jgi:hypothetical protein
MKARSVIFSFCVMVAVVAACGVAFADQSDTGNDTADTNDKPTTRQDDDRLPPVLPGEEVVTQTGQKMRVWSSAGPVPVNPQPTPQTFNGNGYGGAGIIVDDRGFRGR